jgi:hypothetical protein
MRQLRKSTVRFAKRRTSASGPASAEHDPSWPIGERAVEPIADIANARAKRYKCLSGRANGLSMDGLTRGLPSPGSLSLIH